MSEKLTASSVASLKPSSEQYQVHDSEVAGLTLRVQASGRKTWGFRGRVTGRQKYIVLGEFPALSLAAARLRARKIRQEIADGRDPSAERDRRRAEATLAEVWASYRERHVKRPKTMREDEGRWKRHLAGWGGRRPSEVKRGDVVHLLDRIARKSGPYESNRTLALVRHLYTWARCEEMIHCANPAVDVKARTEQARSRAVTSDELRRLLAAISEEADPIWQGYFFLLLLTGCRRSELLNARWEWVDFNGAFPVLSLPSETTKQKRRHVVPLSALARQVLEQLPSRGRSPWIFPGTNGPRTDPKRPWERIRSCAGLGDLRMHDLRHLVGGSLGSAGANAFIVARALGHSQLSTTERYVDPNLAAVASALDSHGDRVRRLIEPTGG